MTKIKGYINVIKSAIYKSSQLDDIVRGAYSQIIKAELFRNITSSSVSGIADKQYFDKNVIVSLTSYGKRIYDVAFVIESIMQQTIKPNKIILWLSETEFELSNLPQILLKQQERGLAIEFTKDIRSYKKLIPALLRYPKDIIITADDDVLYPYDMVENLLKSYKEDPTLIYFYRGRRIKLKKDGNIENYIKWNFVQDIQVCKLNFPTGIGGILYPPHCLYEDVSHEEIFMKLAPKADDVWFYAMALLKDTLSKKCFTHNSNGADFFNFSGEIQTKSALWNTNMYENDKQIRQVFNYYDIWEKILKI